MDIHHLRVVTFDNSLEVLTDKPINDVFEENATDKGFLKSKDHSENSPPINIAYVEDNSEPVDEEKEGYDYFYKESRVDKGSEKNNKPYISKYDRYIKKKEAKQERDKIKDFRKSRKRIKCKYRNTISFENVMKTLSSKNNEYFTRIHNNLQKVRRPSSLIPMHIKRRKNITRSKIPNEVKLLYMSETAKSHRATRKHSPKKHIIDRNLPPRIKSFSSHDLFGLNKSRHIYSPHFYGYNERAYHVNFCSDIFKKNKRRYTERNPKYRPRRSLFKIRRVRSNVSDSCEMPMHFTLVDFPSASNTHCAARSVIKIHDHEADNHRRSCKDKEVLVTPSRFQVSKKTLCDTAVSASRSVQNKHLRSCQTSAHQCKKSSKHVPILTYGPTEIFNKMFCMSKRRFSGKKDNSAIKVILKYFLVGLMIIVWLPCVALLGLLWLLTYPMRPHYDPPDDCLTKCKKEEKEHGFWTPFIGFMKQIAKDTFCSLNAIGGMIKPGDKECKRSTPSCRSPVRRPCRSKSHPDPNEKYTLYYADKRGWIMKPIRRRLAKKQNTFQDKISNGFNKFRQKCSILKREFVIASASPIKKYESSHNKVDLKYPCEHNNAPVTVVPDIYRSPQVSASQRKFVESNQKSIVSKNSNQTQKYGAQNSLVQSPLCKQGPVAQQISPSKKSTAIGPSPTASKSQALHSSPQLASEKKLVSKGTSSPQIRKISEDLKAADMKTPPKEVTLTVARDRRRTQTENKLKMLHRKTALENSTRRVKIKAKRRCKESQCNLIKIKPPACAPCRKKKAKPRKVSFAQNMCCAYKTVCKYFKSLDNADKTIDVCDVKCEDLYLHTLRKKPCFCVHNYCPSIYPFFLMWHKCTMDCFHIMMYVCSFCVWTPIFLVCYSCYWLCCWVFLR